MRINLNELAEKVAAREGKKHQVNIAQIKEIQKIVLQELGKMAEENGVDGASAVLTLLARESRKA